MGADLGACWCSTTVKNSVTVAAKFAAALSVYAVAQPANARETCDVDVP